MKCVTFTVDGLLCGIPIETVRETIVDQRVTPVPLAADEIDGLMNLRGQIVLAVDLRRVLGLNTRLPGDERMNVVVDTGAGPVSLVVDRVGDVVDLADDDVHDPPSTLRGRLRQHVRAAYEHDRRTLLVLDAGDLVKIESRPRLEPDRA